MGREEGGARPTHGECAMIIKCQKMPTVRESLRRQSQIMARAAAKLKPKTSMFRMFRFVLLCFVSFCFVSLCFLVRFAFGLLWFGWVLLCVWFHYHWTLKVKTCKKSFIEMLRAAASLRLEMKYKLRIRNFN